MVAFGFFDHLKGCRIGEATHPGPAGILIGEQETQADLEATSVLYVRLAAGSAEHLTPTSCEGSRWLWILSGQPRRQGSRRQSKREALEAWLASHQQWLAEGEAARLCTTFSLGVPASASTEAVSGAAAASPAPTLRDPSSPASACLEHQQLARQHGVKK